MILHFIKFFSLCNDEFLFLNTFYDFLVLIALVLLNLISWVFRDICICFFSYNQHKFNIFNIKVEYKIDQICFCQKGKFHHPTSYTLLYVTWKIDKLNGYKCTVYLFATNGLMLEENPRFSKRTLLKIILEIVFYSI